MPIAHNIKSIPLAGTFLINSSNFGCKLEAMKAVKPWLETAKIGYLDTKGKNGGTNRKVETAINRFKNLYNVKEYWIQYPDQGPHWSDDSLKIYYTTKH
jgi:hypothetical protein